MSNNNFSILPEEVVAIESLEFLNLGGNKLDSLPSTLDKLSMLKILFFANNDFTHVPNVIGRLKSLFMLSFKGNKLEHIDERSLSPTIQWLILTDNRLEVLPSSIGKLTKLRKLMLSGSN